jgi:hypothetical protein
MLPSHTEFLVLPAILSIKLLRLCLGLFWNKGQTAVLMMKSALSPVFHQGEWRMATAKAL